MQSDTEQQSVASRDQSSIRQDGSALLPGVGSSVPVHSSGNNSDQTAPPQVQIHSSDGPSAPANGAHDSRDLTLPSSEFPASPWAAATRSGSPTSSPASQHGGGPPSQPVQANGISSQATPPANANNDSLAAPIPLPYGHAGPMLGRLGHPLEGRISPRPVSRNNSRASNRDVSYNVDGHARLPGDNRMQLFVGNLPFRVRWQDLKDLFRKCGNVLRSDVALTLDNRSKGFGTVLYANAEDARNAIETFNGYTWQSRVLDVRLDQQDPTGSISLANAAAQQAQQHAYQTHQQAMQNMANMVGVLAGPIGAVGGFPPPPGYPMFGQGPAPSPWTAALANNLRPHAAGPVGFSQQYRSPMQAHMSPARAASPYRAVQLGDDLANMNLRRNSASTEGSSRPSIPQSGSSSSLGRNDAGPKPVASSGTSPTSPTLHSTSMSKASSPSPISGQVEPRDSVSPQSARRAPPGSLGPMPPSMFAGMPTNAHLPNPPAAAAAAVAAGYSLNGETTASANGASPLGGPGGRDVASNSRRGSTVIQDASASVDHYVHQQQQRTAPNSNPSTSPQPGPPPPLPGGLVNFYQQHRGPPAYAQGGSPFGVVSGGGGRNSPAPAFADRQLFVGNIPFNCQWQDLKDLFRAAGSILRADVSLGPDGRSRGFGRVVYATPEDAINAMQMFNGYEFQGRPLKVHFDKFAPGGIQLNQPHMFNMHHPAVHSVHENHFFQTSGQGIPLQSHHSSAGFDAYGQTGQRDFQQANDGQGLPFDDNASIPGTPIHEMSLAQMAAFPSPGFASPMQHPGPLGQSADQRRKGFNAEGVPVAPIGSGAPLPHHEGRSHPQQGHPVPLSPLTIPPMSMAMPSPGPGGLFSPPLPGMGPLMTPSSKRATSPLMCPADELLHVVPGFSFHPFPQTPPLLPHFLSPGLGPFSPPLFGTPGAFVSHNGPSGLRNSAPGDPDTTPLQSPNASYARQEEGNYFPPLPDQPQGTFRSPGKPLQPDHKSVAVTAVDDVKTPSEEGEVASASAPRNVVITPTMSHSENNEPVVNDGINVAHDTNPQREAAPSTGRRASFKEQRTTSLLDVPASSSNRAGSLDIPRPDMKIGDIASLANAGSAVDEGDATPPGASPEVGINSEAPQTKKSAWNLSWLKKQ